MTKQMTNGKMSPKKLKVLQRASTLQINGQQQARFIVIPCKLILTYSIVKSTM